MSELQSCTVQSTAKSQIYALFHFLREVRWMRSINVKLHVLENESTEIFQNDLETISWTESLQGLWKIK